MAIVWGGWVSDRFRTGIELTQSPSTVSATTSSVTITAKVYFQTRYNGWDTGINWSVSGGMSGSGTTAFNHGGNDQYTLMGTVSKTVTPSYTGAITTTVSASTTGWAAYGGTASVSASITTAQRPITAPSGSPGSFTVSRVSDTSQKLSWTMTSTQAQPIPYVDVQRSTDGGAFVQIATLGTVTSYTDTSTTANHKYQYRVRARNSAGSSGWATSGTISTTPAVPAAPTAAKTANGDIVVTRPALSSVAYSWEVWHAANGVWDSTRLASIVAGTTSWTHVAPSNTQTHTYRITASSAGPSLVSGYSASSNTVQLLAAPLAPTGLAPTGGAADATEPLKLTWKHNPVDTTPQTKKQVRYRVVGAATWDERPAYTSSDPSWDITPGVWANGTTVEWQVRTWGSFADPSPYSASATVTLSARPTAAINVPDGTYRTSTLAVEWGYSDAEGSAQSAYEVKLLRNGTLVEEVSGSGPATSAPLSTRLVNGRTYTVRVRVRDGAGLWSAETVSDFLVDFAPPPRPSIIEAEWRAEIGGATVTFATPGPSTDEIEATSAQLWRTTATPRTNLIDNATFAETTTPKVVRTNLLPNPSGEGAQGWLANNGVTMPVAWDTTVFRSGTRSRRGDVATSGTTPVLLSLYNVGDVFTAAPGDVFTASVYVAHNAATTAVGTLTVSFLDTNGVILRSDVTTTPGIASGTDFHERLSITTAAAPASTARARVVVEVKRTSGNAVTGENAWADDALVEKAANLGPYFDGSAPAADGLDYAWTGTAGASASTASGLQPAGGWFTGTGSVVQGPATDTGFSADVRGAGYLVSPVFAGAEVGEHYSAKVLLQGIPGETPAGTTAQVRIHDGLGYIADSAPLSVTLPADGSPVLVEATAKAPAEVVASLRLYIYPNSKPVRVSEPVAERVPAPGIPAGPFIEGSVGEDSWVLVAEGLAPSSTVTDPIPPVNARVTYRVTSVSDTPSSAVSYPVAVDTPAAGVYVNGGPGFSEAVPLLVDPSITDTTTRDRAVVYFAGRSLPLEIAGDNLGRTFAVTAVLLDDGSTPSREDVRDFVVLSGPACLRDPDGTRAFVSVGDATVSGAGSGGARGLSWSFTEIDWQEADPA